MNTLDRRRLMIGAALGGLGAVAAAGLSETGAALAQDIAARELVEKRESQYNTIYIARQGPIISMMFSVNKQLFNESSYDPARPQTLVSAYTRYMTVGLAYIDKPAPNILEIGLGGGRTAMYLHHHVPGLRLTCVELDPEVIALARKHFDLVEDQRLKLITRDGRVYLNQARERFDLILLDAYRGTFVPFHLLTKQFYIQAKRRLAPGGAVVQNIEPTTMLFDAAVATMKSVFVNVDLYDAGGNIVVVGYDGAPKSQAALLARANALQAAHKFSHPLPALLAQRRPAGPSDGQVLTDDFAPVEALRAIERHNAKRPS